jgi:hypothetical protein
VSDSQDPDDCPPTGGHPPVTDRREAPRADPPSVGTRGVELGSLLALARLTAGQALEIGAELLTAVSGEAAGGDDGPAGDRVAVEPMVEADGRVVLGGRGSGGRTGTPTGRTWRTPQAVLADVAAAARRPGAPDPTADLRLAELDRAVRDLPTAGAPVVARRLQEAAAAIDRSAVRAELAALVRAVAGGAAAGAPRTGEPTGAARAEGAGTASPRYRSVARRVGAWLLSILVLAAAVVTEVVLLRDDITADIDMLLDAGRGADQPSAGSGPDVPPLTAPAPAAAGSVLAVDLRSLGRCAPGAPCAVRVQVRLVPAAEPQVVTWSYQVVDLCTGRSSTAPGGSVTTPPQADRAEAVGVVPLPPLDSVAVVAVTDLPAAAASAPVAVGSCRPSGPGE